MIENLKDAQKQLRELRDEANCDNKCQCERYDQVIDMMDNMEKQLEATKLSKVKAIDTKKWANNALHVARFGNSASSGERASYYGLPMLYDALMELSSLDPHHRAAVAIFVTDWANGSTKKLWDTLQEMYQVHDGEKIRLQKVNQ